MKRICFILFLFASLNTLTAQQIPESLLSYDLFAEEEPLEIKLAFDFKKFVKDKHKDRYQEAEISILLPDSLWLKRSLRLKARGEFRKRYCHLPPIKLNFKDTEFPIPSLQQLEKVKLVTNCRYQDSYQQYIFGEYLVYKTYNLLTPLSFRVRLVHIEYIDTEGKRDPFHSYGFLIEEADQMAERNNGILLKDIQVHTELTDRDQMSLVAVFEYAMGNTDWAVGNLHNVKLVKSRDFSKEQVFVVPYDFDYSGMVNTIYAIPQEELGIKSVRTRLYMGYQRSDAELAAVFGLFQQQKEAIYTIWNDFPLMEDRYKSDCIEFLDEFYRVIDSPPSVKREIVEMAKDPYGG